MPEGTTATPVEALCGTVLGEKYRVECTLGTGGMGTVLAARHLQLDEIVAIKVLNPDLRSNPEAVSRFLQEARAAVRIKSEHVARVFDVDTLLDGTPYIVMEYLEGSDLAKHVAAHGAMSLDQSIEIALQTCEALSVAHGLGIVHRDIKPANLFCVKRPDKKLFVKVLDFGISKATAAISQDLSITKTSAVLGSPCYMSPEQMTASRFVDGRTDIWSLGVILYELVSGRLPFEGSTMPEICARVLGPERPSLREHKPDTPRALQELIEKCLEKSPEQRFADIGQLVASLEPFAQRTRREAVESALTQADGGAGFVAQPQGSMAPAPSWSVGDSIPGIGNTRPPSPPLGARQRIARFVGLAIFIVVSVPLLVATVNGLVRNSSSTNAATLPMIRPTESAPISPDIENKESPQVLLVAPVASQASTPPHTSGVSPIAKASSAVRKTSASKPQPSSAPQATSAPPQAATTRSSQQPQATIPSNKWGGRQ